MTFRYRKKDDTHFRMGMVESKVSWDDWKKRLFVVALIVLIGAGVLWWVAGYRLLWKFLGWFIL